MGSRIFNFSAYRRCAWLYRHHGGIDRIRENIIRGFSYHVRYHSGHGHDAAEENVIYGNLQKGGKKSSLFLCLDISLSYYERL